MKRLQSSIRHVIGSKSDVNSPSANGNTQGIANMGSDDDLEMVHRATKANKTVMDDGRLDQSAENKKVSKIADAIDKASRVLFPLAFIGYNVFYWTYY